MSEGIAYQNKDIEFKLLSEVYKEKSFEAYGLKLPRIKEVLPTNLPKVTANEKRMDNLFLLEDDTYAIVDYEAEIKGENCVKYVNYIARVVERYFMENKTLPHMRMIVIYTGDVNKAADTYDMGCMTMRLEQVFVSHLPAEEIYRSIKHKLEHGEVLTEQELMQMIILPLAEKGREKKQRRIEQVIELTKLIENDRKRMSILAGLLVISDKFISKENAEEIRRRLNMNKVFQSIWEDGEREGWAKGREDGVRETAESMLKDGMEIDKIRKYTGLTEKEIKEIQESMLISQ